MRKSIWMFGLLALCAVVLFAVSITVLQSSREAIVVTETTLYGDPAAAEGLQVQTVLNQQRQMFWQTNYAVSAQPEAETRFRFFQRPQDRPYEPYLGEVYISLASMNFGISGMVSLEDNDPVLDVMMEPVKAVAARTNAGETRIEVVQLCQYYDWYPLQIDPISHSLDGNNMIQVQQIAFLQQYFRIPVPETECMEVSVQKDDEGRVTDVDCSQWFGDYDPDNAVRIVTQDSPESFAAYETTYVREARYLLSDSVVTNDQAFLLLYGDVDLSQSQDGYGLYRIPITWHTQWEEYRFSEPQPHLELEQLENIYPMDAAFSEHVRLAAGLDETELLLFEDTETGMVLTVLDTADFSVRQQIALEQQTLPTVWYHENLLLLGYADYETEQWTLQVLQRRDGVYSFWLRDGQFAISVYGGRVDPVFCFDGQRLAAASHPDYYSLAGHWVHVYDQTGLLYAGDYAYSSDLLSEPPNNWNWEDTLQIFWEDAGTKT